MESKLIVPSRTRSAASLVERTANGGDLELDDSAFCALTDFRCEYPITIGADSSINDALAHMSRLAVHALLVTRREVGTTDEQVVGLITSYDIARWRPHRSSRTAVCKEPRGSLVGDVMTSWDDLSLIHYDSLATLTALEVFDLFQGTGLTHLLVVEIQDDESTLARGIISRTSLADRLPRSRRIIGSLVGQDAGRSVKGTGR
jgi:CBS domain-containing protein